MESQQLRSEIPPEMYAWMVLEAPGAKSDAELTRYWMWRGIEAELNERRKLTGRNLSTSEELANALDRYSEHGELGAELGE